MSNNNGEKKEFFKDGFFDWQQSAEAQENAWIAKCYDEEKYWGGFSREPFDAASYKSPDWAITNIAKYENNPIMAPSVDSWDRGHYGGGVHNGSVLKKDGKFYYLYRGEFSLTKEECANHPAMDYKCDVGIATSDDGIHFTKDKIHSPLFRHGEDELFSFEDICAVKHGDTYYMFLNRWDWNRKTDPSVGGVYLATSKDLLTWEKRGMVFPNASRIHRNACVVQNPNNEAVRVNGKFVMYINDGLVGLSDDMLHWESVETKADFPGGEGCLALADYDRNNPDAILLFTGGHHTGHFYAVGEVLFNKKDPLTPIEWLPRPVITAEDKYPFECGYSADGEHKISHWRDTIFFTGMTEHNGKYMFYYGGSEYYTCLAIADAKG
jgi:predicted GH43/DUF377 family glycosyl hydrolase